MTAYAGVWGIDYAKGAEFIADTDTHAGRWCAIHFTSNSQVDAVSSNWVNGGLNGHQFDKGTVLYGVFTSIKLQSGHCAAYRL